MTEHAAVDLRTASEPKDWYLEGGAVCQSLPTAVVTIPRPPSAHEGTDLPSDTAILSWRWDLSGVARSSRNLWAAIQLASRLGFKYLLVDCVSVDQGVSGHLLIQSVSKLAGLYEHIPVIMAYDDPSYRVWPRILRRPWIVQEMHSLRSNPHRRFYVGHVLGRDINQSVNQGIDPDFGIRVRLRRIMRSTIADSILYVLGGIIEMGDISHLRYIMFEHFEVLRRAFDAMPGNDYLLIAAILAHVHSGTDRVQGEHKIVELEFERLRLVRVQSVDDVFEIFLGARQIATWHARWNPVMEHHRTKLIVDEEAENAILEHLGFSGHFRNRYRSEVAKRHASIAGLEPAPKESPDLHVFYMDKNDKVYHVPGPGRFVA